MARKWNRNPQANQGETEAQQWERNHWKTRKTGMNINMQADGKTAQELMKEHGENACKKETGYRTP
eukprot:7580348-Ditylum_brightwellii.AAC.1